MGKKILQLLPPNCFPLGRLDFHMTVLNSYQTEDMYLLRQMGKSSPIQIQMQTHKTVRYI